MERQLCAVPGEGTTTTRTAGPSVAMSPSTARATSLTDLHGEDLYRMARLLTVSPDLARLAVTTVIASVSAPRVSLWLGGEAETLRELGRLVFRVCWVGYHSEAPTGADSVSQEFLTRRARWLDTASLQQRAALALCVYGGHTTYEAGLLLDLSAEEVCDLLRGALHGLAAAAAR